MLFSHTVAAAPHGSPVAIHGQLSVKGTHLINQNKQIIQLTGVSAFWLNYKGAFANSRSISWLHKDWNIQIYRAAMGVENPGGYLHDPEKMIAKIDEIVKSCTQLGLYVIIDYHSHHATKNPAAARKFFDHMSRKYGHLPNVIYELWNEPEKVSWQNDIRPYMADITTVIRKNDPDNLILAGTPYWSSRVSEVLDNRLPDPNTLYVLHFYTGTHRKTIRAAAQKALHKGLPIFVSEFGLSTADGGGNKDRKIYLEEAEKWIQWMNTNKISWCCWSICDKDEASALLKPGASIHGDWKNNSISAGGLYIRNQLRKAAKTRK